MKKANDGEIVKGSTKTSLFSHTKKDKLSKTDDHTGNENNKSSHKHHISRKTLVVIIALLMTVIAVPSVYYFVKGKPKNIENTISEEKHRELIEAGNKLKFQKKYDEAESYWNNLINLEKDNERKIEYSIQLAVLYSQQEKWQETLETYKNIESMGSDSLAVYEGIASCSEKLGDNETALKYYEKSKNILNTDDPDYGARIEYYDSKIAEMGEQ